MRPILILTEAESDILFMFVFMFTFIFYGVPFMSKFFLKDYGSGTNQMGGFVGGAQFLQMADSWTWRISCAAGTSQCNTSGNIPHSIARPASSLHDSITNTTTTHLSSTITTTSYEDTSSNPNFTIDEHYSQPHTTPTVTDFLRDSLILYLSFRI